MSIPPVLLSGVKNESQDLQITTDVLEPNVLNNNQAVFVIPKKASVLDSKSALKVRVNWEGYVANGTKMVGGKLFSGLLGMIKAARLYASGQLISDLRHAGEKIHLDNQFKSQEYKEQYCDVKHLSESGFDLAEGTIAGRSGITGSIQSADAYPSWTAGADADTAPTIDNCSYFRGIGYSDSSVSTTTASTAAAVVGRNEGVEMFLLLEELFPMLKDIQLPVRFMKDEIRIEIDWEQDKTKWIYATGAYTSTDVKISDCVLFLDYITYNPEIDASLEQTIMGTGVSIPFRQTAIITKQLAGLGNNETDIAEDILLGQEGRAVMKIYVAKKYPNVLTGLGGNENQGYNFQGECRSERLNGEKFNCIINDLLIYDRDVENNHEAYSYLSYAGEKPFTAYPDSFEYNDNYDAQAVTTDVLFTTAENNTDDQRVLGFSDNNLGRLKDGIRGQQNWCAVDCSKYGSAINPNNAMRIGSTPIIFRLKRSSGTDVRTKGVVSITCFVEYLRLFDLRGGDLSVRDL